jgi:hypothetical protein
MVPNCTFPGDSPEPSQDSPPGRAAPSPSRAVLTLLAGAMLAVVLGTGYAVMRYLPEGSTAEQPRAYFTPPDPSPEEAAHLQPADTRKQRWAYRACMLVVATGVLVLTRRGLAGWCRRARRGLAATLDRARAVPFFRSRLVCGVLLALLVTRLLPSFTKQVDLSAYGPKEMAMVDMHITFTIAHADRLAAGDVLFDGANPKYGAAVPVLIAAVEKNYGWFGWRHYFKCLLLGDSVYLLLAGLLYISWARHRWALCLLPFLLLLPNYYSVSDLNIPPNHSGLRTFGFPLALSGLLLSRRARPGALHFRCGALGMGAFLINPESGLATCAGLFAYLFLDQRRRGLETSISGWAGLTAFAFAGGLFVAAAFAAFCKLALGAFPSAAHALNYLQYLRVSNGGQGSYPWDGSVVPIIVFGHVAAALFATVLSRPHGTRHCFRAAVCTMFLVWFCYFANRPEPGYWCSYRLLYGFLLIDLGRIAVAFLRRPRFAFAPEKLATFALLLMAISLGYRAVEWHWNPTKWKVITQRWSAPLLKSNAPSPANAVLVEGVYYQPTVVADLRSRADFLRRQVGDGKRRLIYFAGDSFALARMTGIVPWQEFGDPIEAIDRTTFDRLIASVRESGQEVIYIDARMRRGFTFWGHAFDLVRSHIQPHYRLERTECGWEIWRRADLVTADPGGL